MDSKASCYISGTQAEMLWISRWSGLAPLRFAKKGSGWRICLAPRWNYYGYFIITIMILASFTCLILDLQLPPEQSVRMITRTRRVVWIVDAVSMLLIAGTVVFGAAGQMSVLIDCLNRIGKIKFELNIGYWPVHCERDKKRYVFFLMLATITILSTADVILLTTNMTLDQAQMWITITSISYYLCYWILQLREINFVIITLHVMHCFRNVNHGLKILLRSKTLDKGNQKKNSCESVRRLALAYASACDVVRDVDRAHGPFLLMLLGAFLLHLVTTPYYVITSILQGMHTMGIHHTRYMVYVGVELVWCIYHTVNLLMVIEPCHLTQMEMKTTFELVSHLIRCTDSAHQLLATELDTFLKHLYLNQVSYSAMHVTTISRPLVATILGTITTYLVIIIQLQ